MATLNELGNVTSRCPGCGGSLSTFEWKSGIKLYGYVQLEYRDHSWGSAFLQYQLFRCAGCGRGGIGEIVFAGSHEYPGAYRRLAHFFPEVRARLPLPTQVPQGIATEFREAEACLDADCRRAAAGLFRSVLDKTMRANGYKTKKLPSLEKQIDAAAEDGIITKARQRKAHEEVRVLGNDVLHDDWHEITEDDVEASRHYCQRVLEDFYDDRESVEQQLRAADRKIVGVNGAEGNAT